MTREEFIGKLQMVYVGDRNAFNEIVGVYDELENINDKLSSALTSAESRIDKAIEYINKRTVFNEIGNVEYKITDFWFINEILEILKGSDKNG